MADTPKVYVICGNNCKYEGMTKEQILEAITQAVREGTISDLDTGFITTIKTINGVGLKFFYGTQAAYDELSEDLKVNLSAIITDDTEKESLKKLIDELVEKTTRAETHLNGILDGSQAVPQATNAKYTQFATHDSKGNNIANTYNFLGAITGERVIKKSTDLNSLYKPSQCGVYAITWDALSNGLILNTPPNMGNGAAKLIIEADYNNDTLPTVWQTLYLRPTIGKLNARLYIYRRAYTSEEWSDWLRYASADELTNGYLVVKTAEGLTSFEKENIRHSKRLWAGNWNVGGSTASNLDLDSSIDLDNKLLEIVYSAKCLHNENDGGATVYGSSGTRILVTRKGGTLTVTGGNYGNTSNYVVPVNLQITEIMGMCYAQGHFNIDKNRITYLGCSADYMNKPAIDLTTCYAQFTISEIRELYF